MPKVHRIGDSNSAGGSVTGTPQGSVFANNILIAVDGASVSPDSSCNDGNIHCAPNTANGGPTVFAEGIPVNSAGDPDTCGHPRVNGSPNVFTDGGGGGAVYDNSEPMLTAPIIILPSGRRFIPTLQDEYVQENNDVPEEINPPPYVAHPEFNSAPKNVTEQEVDEQQPPPNVPPVQDCSTVDALDSNFSWATGSPNYPDFDTFAAGFQLSPNFRVYDLSIGPAVSTHRFSSAVTQASGLTQKQILQNLCFLSKTILEPLLADSNVPTFTVTSAFRNRSGTSQHNKGQSVDLQIFSFHGTGSTGQQYYDLAQYIRDNFDYDQLILEWFGRNPWIHLSVNPSGHRKSVLTQVSSSSFAPGLRRLG
jgi:uncharacterized Zn-binding protein involved in type VI secretion